MKTAWLVYLPSDGPESSEQPYFVCPQEQIAMACALKMNEFAQRLRKRIERLNVFEVEISDEEHSVRWQKQESMLEKARWPYGVDLRYEFRNGPAIAVKPIKIVERV